MDIAAAIEECDKLFILRYVGHDSHFYHSHDQLDNILQVRVTKLPEGDRTDLRIVGREKHAVVIRSKGSAGVQIDYLSFTCEVKRCVRHHL